MTITVHETFDPVGNLVASEVVDLDAGTVAYIEGGVTVSSRALTADELALYAPTATADTDKLAAAVDALGDPSKLTTVTAIRNALAAFRAALES